MKKLLLTFLIIFTPTIILAETKIGIGFPLSGDAAWLGKNGLEGIKLYLKQNNISQDILITEDISFAQNQNTAGITAIKKMIEFDKVSAMILANSAVVNASAPFIDEKKIPSVAITGAETAKDRNYQVRLWPKPDDESIALVELLKSKRVAILYSEQDSQITRKTSIEKTLGAECTIVYSSAVEIDSVNTIALKVIQSKPEVVVLLLMPGKNGLVAKKLREMKYEGAFVGSVAINSKEEIKLSNGALIGAKYPDSNMTNDFITAFKAEYGHAPDVGAAPAYDAAKLIFEGLKESGTDTEKLNKFIHAENFNGAMGSFGILKDGTNSFKVPVAMRSVGQ